MTQERAVGLFRIDHDHQILSFFRQSHRLRKINPRSKLSHTDCARILGRLAAEVILPVLPNYEVSRIMIHFTQHQRVCDLAYQRSKCLFDDNATIRRLCCFTDNRVYFLKITCLDFRFKVGSRRKLTRQCLTEEMLHRVFQVGCNWRLRIEAIPQRHELFVGLQLMHGIQRTCCDRIQSVCGIEMKLYSLPKNIPLIFEERLGSLSILWRQMIGILPESLAGQDVLKNDQKSQVFA